MDGIERVGYTLPRTLENVLQYKAGSIDREGCE